MERGGGVDVWPGIFKFRERLDAWGWGCLSAPPPLVFYPLLKKSSAYKSITNFDGREGRTDENGEGREGGAKG